MELSVRDLNITTPSITVNAIKINNKQMTLAVFRQLDIGNLSEYILNPIKDITIWGRVNYKTTHKEDNIHINWIVFEKNGFLYRDSVESLYEKYNVYKRRYQNIGKSIEDVKQDIQYRKSMIERCQGFLDIIDSGGGEVFLKIKNGDYYRGHKDNPFNRSFDSIELAKEYFIDDLKCDEEKLKIQNNLESFLSKYSNLKQLFIAV